jgi:hypothetical protein
MGSRLRGLDRKLQARSRSATVAKALCEERV